MIDILNSIRVSLVYLLISLMVLGFIFIILLKAVKKIRTIGIIGLLSILTITIIIVILNLIITRMSINEMYNELDLAEKNNYPILLNGEVPKFNKNELYNEIRKKDIITFRNHTSNTNEFKIEILKYKE